MSLSGVVPHNLSFYVDATVGLVAVVAPPLAGALAPIVVRVVARAAKLVQYHVRRWLARRRAAREVPPALQRSRKCHNLCPCWYQSDSPSPPRRDRI